MPPTTVAAFRDHGWPALRIEQDLDSARATLAALERLGIDFDAVLAQLEAAGVASFAKSYESLLQVIADRVAAGRPQGVVGGRGRP